MEGAEIVKFTDAAKQEITRFVRENKLPDSYRVRIGIRGGGCGGVSYMLGFDELREEDGEYTLQGLNVIIDKRHSMYVMGMEIDFRNDAEATGFVFINPVKKKQTIEQK